MQWPRIRLRPTPSGFSFLLVLCCASALRAQDGRYAGQVLVRTEPVDRAQLAFVLERAQVVLSDHPRVGPLPVVLPERVLPALRAAGVRYRIVQRELDRAFAAERERLAQQRPLYSADPATFLQDFRGGDEIDAHLDTLAALAPERVTVIDVGKSLENRPIRALRIAADSRERPAYLLIGTQHAREWVATMVSVCLADSFIRRYDSDPKIKLVQERLAIVIAPVVNPDGYEHSRTSDRLWRKNRRPGGGVDLNRNWAQGWDAARGPTQSSELFPGPDAFSEPESQAVADLMDRLPKLAAFLDIHTDGQMVVRPLAYTSTPAPNGPEILEWADTMSKAMTAAHGVNHHIERAGETDPTGGLAQDYATIKFGVVGLTMELRQGTSAQGFGDRASNIAPTCDEALAGFLSVAVPLAEATPGPPPLTDAGAPMPGDDAGASDAGSTAQPDAGVVMPSGGTGGPMQPTAGASGTGSPLIPMPGTAGAPEIPQAGVGAPAVGALAGAAAQPPPIATAPIASDESDSGCSIHATGRQQRSPRAALSLLALASFATCVRSARRRRGR
ncbi:MAG TPA: M14 family zinc carboxypeptidase [Polyangiales bacterium]|nr:M14 family zinc carboxypeptidase [Polyangiales bacterium]